MQKQKKARLVEILLIEDNFDDVEFIQLCLQEAKLVNRPYHVWDGEAAIAFLQNPENSCPDLILLDLNLPKLDGRDVLQIIKHDKSLQTIPIVVLTTSGLEVDAQTYAKYIYAYLNKPVMFDDFVQILSHFNGFGFQIVKLPPRC